VRRSVDEFELVELPGLVKPGLQRAVEPEELEPGFAGDGLDGGSYPYTSRSGPDGAKLAPSITPVATVLAVIVLVSMTANPVLVIRPVVSSSTARYRESGDQA
jgi:hypothetical protein